VQHGTGARHPLAGALERWSFEPTGAAIRAQDTVRFLQTGLELVLAEVVAADAGGVTLAGGERLVAERVIVLRRAGHVPAVGAPRARADAVGPLLLCPA
jgi:hypothetical protein